MKFNDVNTYIIQIQGRVEEVDVQATSPIPFAVELINDVCTTISLQTDPSGLIGLIRHLHGLGFILISMSCGPENLPDSGPTVG